MGTDGGCQLHRDTENQFDNVGASRDLPLRLGQVDFINCLPINLPIELGEVKINAKIINSVPSELNKMILKGEIDIAPVSSVTYLENKDKLVPIADLCIASDGPADSVLLFSKFPIEELDGAKIALSHASATSNKLLEIILKEFLKVNASFCVETHGHASLPEMKYPAYLLIGDHALLEYSKMPRDIFIYDLGSLWKKYTGLPMTFGIWVARKETCENFLVETRLIASLRQSLDLGLGPMFDKVIKKAQGIVLISKDFYSTYFQHLKYDYTEECKRGLEIFEELLNKTQATFANVIN